MDNHLEEYGLGPAADSQAFVDWIAKSFDNIIEKDKCLTFSAQKKLKETSALWSIDNTPIYVSEILLDQLFSKEPPTLDFFLSLPSVADITVKDLRAHYLHYVAVLEHPDDIEADSYVIVGSCSSKESGSRNRVSSWGKRYQLPQYVKQKIDEGWEITHMGILDMMKTPTSLRESMQPAIRSHVLMLETAYTYTLWTVYQGQSNHARHSNTKQMAFMCPWIPSELSYKGLSSHSPMMEGVSGIELSPEDFRQMSLKAREKKHARWKNIDQKVRTEKEKLGRQLLRRQRHGEQLNLDEKDQKSIVVAQKIMANARISSVRHRATKKTRRELLEKWENDDEMDPTLEQQFEIAIAMHETSKLDVYQVNRATKMASLSEILEEFEQGSLVDPTLEQKKKLDEAREARDYLRNKNERKAKAAREKAARANFLETLLKSFEDGNLLNPTPEQEMELQEARESREHVQQLKTRKAAARKITAAVRKNAAKKSDFKKTAAKRRHESIEEEDETAEE